MTRTFGSDVVVCGARKPDGGICQSKRAEGPEGWRCYHHRHPDPGSPDKPIVSAHVPLWALGVEDEAEIFAPEWTY